MLNPRTGKRDIIKWHFCGMCQQMAFTNFDSTHRTAFGNMVNTITSFPAIMPSYVVVTWVTMRFCLSSQCRIFLPVWADGGNKKKWMGGLNVRFTCRWSRLCIIKALLSCSPGKRCVQWTHPCRLTERGPLEMKKEQCIPYTPPLQGHDPAPLYPSGAGLSTKLRGIFWRKSS